ncbi:hypothetical protein EBT31_12340 [bacterium]|jgi:hypothetical protein|nr:hypothetical protein [bacterium]
MSTNVSYNQLTASIICAASLFSIFAGFAAQGTTSLETGVTLAAALTLAGAAFQAWRNKSPMLVGLLVCTVAVLVGIMIMVMKRKTQVLYMGDSIPLNEGETQYISAEVSRPPVAFVANN